MSARQRIPGLVSGLVANDRRPAGPCTPRRLLRAGFRGALGTAVAVALLAAVPAAAGQSRVAPARPSARGDVPHSLASAVPADDPVAPGAAGEGYLDLGWVVTGDDVTPVDAANGTAGPSVDLEEGDLESASGGQLSPDGRYLYIGQEGTYYGPEDTDIVLDTSDPSALGGVAASGEVAFSPASDVAYFGSGASSISAVDLADPTSVAETLDVTYDDEPLDFNHLSVSPDGTELFLSTSTGLYVFSLLTDTVVAGPVYYDIGGEDYAWIHRKIGLSR
jgi:hypothetical protein